MESTRPRPREWRDTFAPDRIGEDANAIDLEEHGGVPEPGRSKSRLRRTRPRFERAVDRDRPGRCASLRAEEELAHETEALLQSSRSNEASRLRVVEDAVAPPRRALDSLATKP